MGGRPRVSCDTQTLRDHMAYNFRIQLVKVCVSRRRGGGFGHRLPSQEKSECSKCSSVMGLTKSAPDTGLRVTPMIPPRNSLAVGWVATRTVVSPQ